MTDQKRLTSAEISAIVDGLNPIDWAQMELLAKMPPGKRIYASPRKHHDTRWFANCI